MDIETEKMLAELTLQWIGLCILVLAPTFWLLDRRAAKKRAAESRLCILDKTDRVVRW